MTRLLILDIDGVFATLRSHTANGNKGGLIRAWDSTSCEFVKNICFKHGLRIVISSSWRGNRMNEALALLATHGLYQFLYDPISTPRVVGSDSNRGSEIKMLLDQHLDVTNYIILDDDSDFLEEQKPFHVKTSTYNGITYENMVQILGILDSFPK